MPEIKYLRDLAWTFPSREISATRRKIQLDNVGKGKLLEQLSTFCL